MAEILKSIYVIITSFSLFLVATNIEGMPFYRFHTIFYRILVTLSYSLFISRILVTLSYSLFISGVHFRCFKDSDCVKLYCRPPLKSMCMYRTNCKCIAVYTQEDYVLT
jgi:hypothetical protein